MMNDRATTLDTSNVSAIDIGQPVEWMVDPERREVVLGVTYVFSQTGERKTVWYTANKRRAKVFVVVTDLPVAEARSDS